MNYSYQDLKIDDWNNLSKEIADVNIYGQIDFLLSTAKVYNLDICCDAVLFKGKPILLVAFFVSNHKIVFPNHYLYQFVWENNTNEESWVKLEACDFLIKIWKEKYTSIDIRLPIKIKDLRPFIWNGFSVKLKYTYIKGIKEINYHHNINRIIKKKQEIYSFDKNCNWNENWVFHFKDLLKFGVRKIHVNLYLAYFKELKAKSFVQVYNAYFEGAFLTSIVAIVDFNKKIAYFPLIGTADGHYDSGLPTLLYHYALTELKSSGIESVDLFGANIKNIARYKSKFLPELQCFYEVSYSKRNEKFKNVLMKFRLIIGKVLFWVKL